MHSDEKTVEIPLTLHLSEKARQKIAQRATASGTDVADYISNLVELNAKYPLTLEEISGPVYQNFLDSGLTDDQLSDLLEAEKHEDRANRRARHAS